MLTVIKYRGNLYYVMGASKSVTDGNYLTGLKVDTGTFDTLLRGDCDFQYFVNDKGHKLDLNFKRIKEKV